MQERNNHQCFTLDEIRQRYVDINGTDEGFDNYVADGFYDGNVKEYRPV